MSEEEEEQATILERYIWWLFEGNILFVPLKFVWTGMWMTAFLTFQFIEGVVILAIGAGIWFIANDWQNWEVEFE